MVLKLRPKHLENEKKDFIEIMRIFLEGIDLQQQQHQGRPRTPMSDIIASLLIMSYHGWSFRRSESDIEELYEKGIISFNPKKSTLHKYMSDSEIEKILVNLIEASSLYFIDSNDTTLIIDSTWYQKFMNLCQAHHQNQRSVKLAPQYKTRKIHVAMLKESKMIVWAKATPGQTNDTPLFEEMLNNVTKRGFNIDSILADKGYMSKKNYALCQELGIKNIFIDFRKNVTGKRPQGQLWRDRVKVFKDNPLEWRESYRYRVLIESLFSTIKRKGKNYIRNQKDISQNCELLLKALSHNLTIIAKFEK